MKKTCTLLVVLVAMLLLGSIGADAQPGQSQYDCIIVDGRKCYIIYDSTGLPPDTVCDEGSKGIGSFIGSRIPPSGRVDADLIPVAIIATISDPVLGTITTRLNRERTAGPTTLRSIGETTRFPLAVNIPFHATASVESAPGIIYESRTPLTFASNSVTSVNPFNAESLTLSDDVEFYNPADSSQQTAFTLQGGSTGVTLGVKQPRPQYSCILINGRKCYVYYDDNGNPIETVCDQGGTGIGTFTSLTGPFPAQGVVNAELVPIDISTTISDSLRGTITTQLDPTRHSSTTTIRSVSATRFPLDVNISFYAVASAESAPGTTYRSRTELVFSRSGVASLNPFRGEVVTLKNNVEFYDAADSTQHTVFSLQAGSTSVTLGTRDLQGPVYNCIIINGRKCYIYYDPAGNPIDTVCDDGSKGLGTFRSLTDTIPPQGPVDAVLAPVAITASVRDATFGNITTALDPERPSSPTTIRSVDGRNRFPLDVNISFYATASAESAPGTTYRSRTQLVFASKGVRSLIPFIKEQLTLKNDVEFYNADDPSQRPVFTLRGGVTTVTLSEGIARVDAGGNFFELKLDLK